MSDIEYAGVAVSSFFVLLFLSWAYRRARKLKRNREFVSEQKSEMLNIIAEHKAKRSKGPSEDKQN
jgi:hypothetical protein